MESQQSVMLQTPSDVVVDHVNSKSGSSSEVQKPRNSTWDFGVRNRNKLTPLSKKSDEVNDVVEVFIHQARDIHNVCIYHKQDVYAKLCLTSDPDTAVTTQIVNGGGKNPVFNENVSLNVQTVDSSVKCEIWMLSRVRNYLEDQLLGFALVPLSDVLKENGAKLSQEFTLSSTDLFHSPAGFVELSLTYIGSCPDVLELSAPHLTSVVNGNGTGLVSLSSPTEELEKLEFPDPNLLNENHLMVSEYFELSCTDLHGQDSFALETEAKCPEDNSVDFAQVGLVDSFNGESNARQPLVFFFFFFFFFFFLFFFSSLLNKPLVQASRTETITSSVSTNDSPSPTPSTNESASSQSVHTTKHLPHNKPDAGEAESGSSNIPTQDFAKLAVNVPILVSVEPENQVVQQDYVDMYLKSMQQFTDSLAKMKLPTETENNSSGSISADSNTPTSNGNKGQKVFYGSRAFF